MKIQFLRKLVISILFFSASAYADRLSPDNDVLVYGNGMNNSPELAVLSLYELQDALEKSEQHPQKFSDSYLVYNNNERWWAQVWQVVKQKLGERKFVDVLDSNELKSFSAQDDHDVVLEPPYDEDDEINDEDLKQHLIFYRSVFNLGRRAVVVSHSQGCFYANEAFERLSSEFSNIGDLFKNVQVASPSKFVKSGGPWITFSKDVVINSVRFATSALPANFEGPKRKIRDVFNHSFIGSYLTHPLTRDAISEKVFEQRH